MEDPKLVVIVGETASGKSAMAMEIAKKFNGEIISADSWQVYKGFDIGTAKPSQEEKAQIAHHLIDIKDANDGFSAAEYKTLANQTIKDVAARARLPILVGGTGLYVDAVLFDFSFLPAGDPKTRARLQKLSINELLSLLKQQNIELTGIDIRNKRRLIRLLETNGQRPTSAQIIRSNTLVIGVKLPRAKLRESIEKRVESMFRRGLKHEVGQLAKKYGWETEPMKGIGYREFKNYFDGEQSLAQTRRKVVKSTLELAKRQRTWFKRRREIVWVGGLEPANELVRQFVGLY